jgi:hypothetical protein
MSLQRPWSPLHYWDSSCSNRSVCYLELSCVSLIAELPVRVAKYMLDA